MCKALLLSVLQFHQTPTRGLSVTVWPLDGCGRGVSADLDLSGSNDNYDWMMIIVIIKFTQKSLHSILICSRPHSHISTVGAGRFRGRGEELERYNNCLGCHCHYPSPHHRRHYRRHSRYDTLSATIVVPLYDFTCVSYICHLSMPVTYASYTCQLHMPVTHASYI